MTNSTTQALKILIAEDSATDRLILESIVAKAGHVPLVVCDGIEAIERYREENPDIVLLDVMMPKLGGIDAAKKIREVAREDIVPIIFLTSLSDQESLVECLEAGGDDFIPKPYNQVVLQSKINSFGRLRRMHSTVLQQKQQIEDHNCNLIREQTVAKQVFDKVAHTGCLELPQIRYYMSPLAVFNGDVLVSEVNPMGNLMMLLGDFTGHGLPAAIGSMPLASTFYAMVRKGFTVGEILAEINKKLNSILPVGFFCCAVVVEVNFAESRLTIWNGGLPEAFILRNDSGAIERVASGHLPLGVLSANAFKCNCRELSFRQGDRIFMWSDGIFEARNADGEMFGDERLHQIFENHVPAEQIFDSILENVHGHIGSSAKDDDITLAQVEMREPESLRSLATTARPREWYLNVELVGTQLQDFDPLTVLDKLQAEVPALKAHSTLLYTIIAELFTNALEYGILGMSSFDKNSANGFADYYRERTARLDALTEGKIRFECKHIFERQGGVLSIQVKDSGPGFEPENAEHSLSPTAYSGRGLHLIKSLAHMMTIYPPGNHIQVVYRWLDKQ